jgi:hypothetical protein
MFAAVWQQSDAVTDATIPLCLERCPLIPPPSRESANSG